MSDAAHRLSDAELDELTRRLNARPVPRDASALSPSRVVDIASRKPLGLGIAPGDIDEPERDRSSYSGAGRPFDYRGPEATAKKLVDASIANLPAAAWDKPATMRDLVELGIGQALAAVFDGDDAILERVAKLRKEMADAQTAQRNEIAELKLAHGKLVNENQALRLILENLRITQRGERGVDGDRGPPGRDGVQGPVGHRGERGERGERGLPAARIVGWESDDVNLVAYPLMQTGHRGPGLRLRPALDAYSDQCASEDD